MPCLNGESLFINGLSAYAPAATNESFDRLLTGMRDVKRQITKKFGRPTIRVEGCKHLSAAFAFGRVFQPFDLNIRQTATAYWHSSEMFDRQDLLFERLSVAPESPILVVEISTGHKVLTDAVDRRLHGAGPFSRLILRPDEQLNVNSELCRTLTDQVYRELEIAVKRTRAKAIHLFTAVPQSFMMMLGRKFAGMPETFAYDFIEGQYGPARRIPSGVL
jgi:hypothetical protein